MLLAFLVAQLSVFESFTEPEVGLRTAEDLDRLRSAGFDAFLIGERFMTEKDPGAAMESLLSAVAARAAVG